jgi:hypothetical protein
MPRIFGGFDITLRMTLELVFIRNNVGISTKTIFLGSCHVKDDFRTGLYKKQCGNQYKDNFF